MSRFVRPLRGSGVGGDDFEEPTGDWTSPRGATLLLVCEDPRAAPGLRDSLEEQGFRVIAVTDAPAACAVLRGLEVDAVVRVGSASFRAGHVHGGDLTTIDDEGDPSDPARLADAVRVRLCVDRCSEQSPTASA